MAKFCSHCGNEVMEEAVICTNCGCSLGGNLPVQQEDKVSGGIVLLSVLFPIVGIILWIVKHKETPHAARTYGIAAIISWGVSIIFFVIYMAVLLPEIFEMYSIYM